MASPTPASPRSRLARGSAIVSASLAGELNRARVLKTLYAHGPLPRPELARLTGSTRATIGQIVQPLLDDAVAEELEPLARGVQGGKPARPLWSGQAAALGRELPAAELTRQLYEGALARMREVDEFAHRIA